MSTVNTIFFKKMCLRAAKHHNLTDVEKWDDMDPALQDMYLKMEYSQVVIPLIHHDRYNVQLSWQRLSIKYQLPVTTIRDLTQKTSQILAENRRVIGRKDDSD